VERLQTAHLWADLVSKVLGAIALVVAAWWTYANFTVERTHDPTMEVSVEPAVYPLEGGRVLLDVDVFLKNAGKVAIMPRFPASDTDRDAGLEISIVEMAPTAASRGSIGPAATVIRGRSSTSGICWRPTRTSARAATSSTRA